MSRDERPVTDPGEALALRPSALSEGVEPEKKRGFRLGIGPQLYLGLLGGVLLTLSASLVAYFSFHQIVQHGSRLTESSIPNLSSAVDAARQSSVVVNGALRLISASSLQEHGTVAEELAREQSALSTLIQELASRTAFGQQTRLIEDHLAELSVHLELIQQSAARRLIIAQMLEGLKLELDEANRRIEQHIVTLIDDQEFYLVEGLRRLQDQPSPINERASEAELTYSRDLTSLNHQANLAVLLLSNALALSDRGLLPPLRERFRSTVQNFRRAYARLSARTLDNVLGTDLERLAQMGEADEGSAPLREETLPSLTSAVIDTGIIPLREETLLRLEQEQAALAKGREASGLLLTEVNTLVEEINAEAVESSNAAQSAAQTGRLILGVLNVLTVSGALLLGWLFVGRYMIRRLVGLATAMRSMAGGDLEVPVEVKGNDEVTDMANALEVFRRYALEVQRLNLVEKLAKELDAKNHTLEQTLEHLEQAQEQIVAEQKLASLGQLTAGVAHEIKNPLNFVSNFSEVSVELVDEIEEVMEEAKTGEVELSEEVTPILSDLRLNLQKVKEHSLRADGIVRSMLEHSRSGPGDWRETDLNALLKQYVDLSYHAVRARNTDFNVTLTQDLDPAMGMLTVVPQDIGRVFLNLVTNACQALDEKRQTSDGGFEPELRIASRRLEDHAEFDIRDNGTGIPEELRERIFEPFVTTKKPGEGTGLGLSLITDILTRHGGSIRLDTEEGVFTEMRVILPLEPPQDTDHEPPAAAG